MSPKFACGHHVQTLDGRTLPCAACSYADRLEVWHQLEEITLRRRAYVVNNSRVLFAWLLAGTDDSRGPVWDLVTPKEKAP